MLILKKSEEKGGRYQSPATKIGNKAGSSKLPMPFVAPGVFLLWCGVHSRTAPALYTGHPSQGVCPGTGAPLQGCNLPVLVFIVESTLDM